MQLAALCLSCVDLVVSTCAFAATTHPCMMPPDLSVPLVCRHSANRSCPFVGGSFFCGVPLGCSLLVPLVNYLPSFLLCWHYGLLSLYVPSWHSALLDFTFHHPPHVDILPKVTTEDIPCLTSCQHMKATNTPNHRRQVHKSDQH